MYEMRSDEASKVLDDRVTPTDRPGLVRGLRPAQPVALGAEEFLAGAADVASGVTVPLDVAVAMISTVLGQVDRSVLERGGYELQTLLDLAEGAQRNADRMSGVAARLLGRSRPGGRRRSSTEPGPRPGCPTGFR